MKQRLDQILLEQDLVDNRNKARGLIIDGKVIINNEKITKPGTLFDPEKIKIQLILDDNKFVSRAGAKLDKAVHVWNINLKDKVCLDIGSSTGGFTDCCLQNDASFVFALDVGTNQLDWKLRNNPKVQSMEKTNFRYATKDMFSKEINFFCCDVSFISVKKILEPLTNILSEGAEGVILIKPQFESEIDEVKKGVVKDPLVHIKDIEKVIKFAMICGLSSINLDYSPILGNKKKNIEYLLHLKRENEPKRLVDSKRVTEVVTKAQELLVKGDLHE